MHLVGFSSKKNVEQVPNCGPKYLGSSLEHLVAGVVYYCCTYRLLPNNVPYAFLFMAITLISARSENITIIKFYITLGDVLPTSADVLPHKFH